MRETILGVFDPGQADDFLDSAGGGRCLGVVIDITASAVANEVPPHDHSWFSATSLAATRRTPTIRAPGAVKIVGQHIGD